MDIWGTGNGRKPFAIRTKRIEWLKAVGEKGKKPLLQYLADGKIPKLTTSNCRVCKRTLTWGDGTYDFDHKDNNKANNSQNNCYLVCKVCHGKHTKTKVVKERGFLGAVVGHKTIKLKIGYKKVAKKPVKKMTRKRSDSIFDL